MLEYNLIGSSLVALAAFSFTIIRARANREPGAPGWTIGALASASERALRRGRRIFDTRIEVVPAPTPSPFCGRGEQIDQGYRPAFRRTTPGRIAQRQKGPLCRDARALS